MRESLRAGRLAGITVTLNWSVVVIVLLLTWILAEDVLPRSAPGSATPTYWVVGLVGAALLICSLLAHEVAHAVVARGAGVEVESISLWAFGGVATLRGQARTPGADFRIAAVGPLTSFALGGVFGSAYFLLDAAGQPELLVALAGWLSTINVVLAVFNLVPGAPLDGGRILRAALWHRSGDRYRAAETATSVGQGVAYALIALGIMNTFAGDTIGGLWLVFIGWFLLTAARAEQTAGTTEHVLHGVLVAQVMSSPVETGSAELSVAEFIDRHVLSGRHSAYPVVDRLGTVVGLVTLDRLRGLEPSRRASTPVRDVALPMSHVAVAHPRELLTDVLPRVTHDSGSRVLVFEEGRLVGIVAPVDVAHTLDARALVVATHQ